MTSPVQTKKFGEGLADAASRPAISRTDAMRHPTDRSGLPPELTPRQLLAELPADVTAISTASDKGRRLRRTLQRGLMHLIVREVVGSLHRGHRGRTASEVVQTYGSSYTKIDKGTKGQRPGLYRFGTEYIAMVPTMHIARLILRRLCDVISSLSPLSICEVGSGNGKNLFYLASRLPGVALTGYELTESGTTAARLAQQADLPNTELWRTYEIDAGHLAAVRAIRFEQGSAFCLPAADKSFDLVYTVCALEQMQDGLPRALAELRRVSARYVLFYEPFQECNDLLGRLYLWSRNYFRLSTASLPEYGLRPVATWYSVPVKATFAYGFVLCEVI